MNTELCAELCDGWLPDGSRSPGARRPTVRRSTPGFARRRPAARCASTSSAVVTVRFTDDVQAALDGHEAAHRHVRRRHGQRHAQLPPRGDGPPGVSRSRRPHPGAVAGRPEGRRRSPRCPTSISSRPRCSDRRPASGSDGSAASPREATGVTGADRRAPTNRRRSSCWPSSPVPETRVAG